MSDSHGDAGQTRRAIKLLESHGATKLVHCGDVCSESVLDEFAGHDVTFVWGNCDSPSPQARKYVESLGLKWPKVPAELEVEGKKIAVFHGHERQFDPALESGQYDYVLYGHTHRFSDDRVGKTRMINPGALYRAAVKTVATLDPASGVLDFWRVDTGERVTSRPR